MMFLWNRKRSLMYENKVFEKSIFVLFRCMSYNILRFITEVSYQTYNVNSSIVMIGNSFLLKSNAAYQSNEDGKSELKVKIGKSELKV